MLVKQITHITAPKRGGQVNDMVSKPTVDRTHENNEDPEIWVTLENGHKIRFFVKGLSDETYIKRARLLESK